MDIFGNPIRLRTFRDRFRKIDPTNIIRSRLKPSGVVLNRPESESKSETSEIRVDRSGPESQSSRVVQMLSPSTILKNKGLFVDLQSFSRMFGPCMQPPIHVDTRSPTSLIQPSSSVSSPVRHARIEIAVKHLHLSLIRHEPGILMACPSHRILPDFATVKMLGLSYSSGS